MVRVCVHVIRQRPIDDSCGSGVNQVFEHSLLVKTVY